ncbi:hypothetical protein ACFY12_33515 [Streptomyces sp. NPDC001339]
MGAVGAGVAARPGAVLALAVPFDAVELLAEPSGRTPSAPE